MRRLVCRVSQEIGLGQLRDFVYLSAGMAQCARTVDPTADTAWAVEGQCLRFLRRSQEALAAYQCAAKLARDGEDAKVYWVMQEHVLHALGQSKDARSAILRALTVNGSFDKGDLPDVEFWIPDLIARPELGGISDEAIW